MTTKIKNVTCRCKHENYALKLLIHGVNNHSNNVSSYKNALQGFPINVDH